MERIQNQIAKADVLVADMTERNANVSYEVGYAHALGKLVVLLVKDAMHITFGVNQYPHIIYSDGIAALKSQLAEKLAWAIEHVRRHPLPSLPPPIELMTIDGNVIPPAPADALGQQPDINVFFKGTLVDVNLTVSNRSQVVTKQIDYLYALLPHPQWSQLDLTDGAGDELMPMRWHPLPIATHYSRRFRLPDTVPAMPPSAMEQITLTLRVSAESGLPPPYWLPIRLEFCTDERVLRYDFRICAQRTSEPLHS